jgi:hypothetical protein
MAAPNRGSAICRFGIAGRNTPGGAADRQDGETSVSEQHEMVLSGTTDSGAEEWACPTCGRRIVFRWPPHYEKLVLEYGDANAVHVGGKGGLRVGSVAVIPAAATEVPAAEHDWLRDNGIDWDGTSA